MGDQLGDQKRLTARFVETVKKAGKYFDENGLFLRVKEGGSKKWVQRYTFSGKYRDPAKWGIIWTKPPQHFEVGMYRDPAKWGIIWTNTHY